MKHVILLIFITVLLLPVSAAAQDPANTIKPINDGEAVTLNKCIDIALQNQPSMAAARYNIRAGESRIGEAQSAYFPQVNAQAGYSRIKPISSNSISNSLTGGSSSFDQYSASASLTQTIYDFGKTPTQVNIQKLNLNAIQSDYDATRAQTILAVKQAYYGLLQAQRNLEVAKQTVAQLAQHLDQAKGFYEVGTHPKFDVTKAEVDLSNAKLNEITANNALRIAHVTLNNAMGLIDVPVYSVDDSLEYIKKDISMSQAIESALKNRPEIQATDHRVRASEKSIDLARKGYFPVITGNAEYNRQSGDTSFRDEGWNAGIMVTFPIFSGFLTHHQVQESIAISDAAKANFDLLKQSVVLEVQQAFLNLKAAEERIPTAELGVKQATENLDIANGRYAAGVGNPVEVTDAQVAYTNAKTSYIQALYDYNIAFASLDKAIGIK
ncbi:MAG TPA: TolC family protein [Dissulfurispiraceae bacterium]|nr:TolC family protein [Dissulfurispiraceae bacterium]